MTVMVTLPAGHPLTGPVGDFLTDLTTAGRSPHTVRGDRGDLAAFAAGCGVQVDGQGL